MVDSIPAASVPSHAGPSRSSSRHDIEGLGKFKLAGAAPRGNSYKAKFHGLREKYDVVTSQQVDLQRELEAAKQRLKAVQAENDLLLDAMQIVTPTQPGLVGILHQIEPDPTVAGAVLGLGTDVDRPKTNGNANGRTLGLNGHAHARAHDYEYTGDHSDCVPVENDAMLTDRDYPVATSVNGR